MLYQFRSQQNAKKAHSIHATYLLSGIRKQPPSAQVPASKGENGAGDSFVTSSPFPSSAGHPMEELEEAVPTTTVMLCKEEQLDGRSVEVLRTCLTSLCEVAVKAQFDRILWIHIYSLESGTLKDVQILSSCNEEIASQYAAEDPLEMWRQYGTIHNPRATRRPSKRPTSAAPPASSLAPASAKPPKMSEDKPGSVAMQSSRQELKPSAPSDTPNHPPKKSQKKVPDTKKLGLGRPSSLRKESSSLSESFAKTKPKVKREDTDGSAGSKAPSTGTASEDVPMKDVSEEEQEEDLMPSKTEKHAAKEQARKEREEQLRKMMEEEDEDGLMPDDPDEAGPMANDAHKVEPVDSPVAAAAAASQMETEAGAEAGSQASVSNGRRRGRRRVMKKRRSRTKKDTWSPRKRRRGKASRRKNGRRRSRGCSRRRGKAATRKREARPRASRDKATS